MNFLPSDFPSGLNNSDDSISRWPDDPIRLADRFLVSGSYLPTAKGFFNLVRAFAETNKTL